MFGHINNGVKVILFTCVEISCLCPYDLAFLCTYTNIFFHQVHTKTSRQVWTLQNGSEILRFQVSTFRHVLYGAIMAIADQQLFKSQYFHWQTCHEEATKTRSELHITEPHEVLAHRLLVNIFRQASKHSKKVEEGKMPSTMWGNKRSISSRWGGRICCPC